NGFVSFSLPYQIHRDHGQHHVGGNHIEHISHLPVHRTTLPSKLPTPIPRDEFSKKKAYPTYRQDRVLPYLLPRFHCPPKIGDLRSRSRQVSHDHAIAGHP